MMFKNRRQRRAEKSNKKIVLENYLPSNIANYEKLRDPSTKMTDRNVIKIETK